MACIAVLTALVAVAPAAAKTIVPTIPGAKTYACSGPQLTLFDNSNTQGVQSGGTPPSFSTHGRSYCVLSLGTYHWNNGQGQAPGSIALGVVSGFGGRGQMLSSLTATGSSGQGGVANVNWTATAAQPFVINGRYRCLDSDPASWSQNQASGGHGFCTVVVRPAHTTTPPRPAKPIYACMGPQLTLLDNSNGFGVVNGGKRPGFNTYVAMPGVTAYCLNSIITYHWNNGIGSAPGTIGLGPLSWEALFNHPQVSPRKAKGSSGQGGAPNVNWTVDYPAKPATIIGGAYYCRDSNEVTWSSNQESHGDGFCRVYATPAYVTGFTWAGGSFPQPVPSGGPSTAPPKKKGRIKCFTGTLSSMLLYPIHVAPDAWGLLLLHCAIKQKDGFEGRLTPSSMFVIDHSCTPFWTYPFASGNPPPPVFLHYTGQPNSPCANAQIFIPFQVTGPWRVDIQAHDLMTGGPLRPEAYSLWVRYPGGDVAAENNWNVP